MSIRIKMPFETRSREHTRAHTQIHTHTHKFLLERHTRIQTDRTAARVGCEREKRVGKGVPVRSLKVIEHLNTTHSGGGGRGAGWRPSLILDFPSPASIQVQSTACCSSSVLYRLLSSRNSGPNKTCRRSRAGITYIYTLHGDGLTGRIVVAGTLTTCRIYSNSRRNASASGHA